MSVSTVLAIAVVFFAVAGAFFGMIRGFGRSFMRIMTVCVAFLGSAYICRALVADTDRILRSRHLARLVNRLGGTVFEGIEKILPEVHGAVVALPIAILAPILFVVLFFLFSTMLMLVYAIFAVFIFPKRCEGWSPLSHLCGAIVGVAQGALIALVVMVPVVGFVEVAGDAIDVICQEQGKYESAAVTKIKGYRGKLEEAENSPVFFYAKRFGAERISDRLMTASYRNEEGKKISIKAEKEIVSIAGMYAHAMPLLGTDVDRYGKTQVAAVDKLARDLEGSQLMRQVIASMVSNACIEWRGGGKYLGVEPPMQGEGEVGEFLATFYDAFDESTAKTIVSDFKTLADVFDLFVDYGVFANINNADVLQVTFTDAVMLEALFDILDANVRMQVLYTALIEISIKTFCTEHVDIPEQGDENYEQYQDMLGSVTDVLNEIDSEAELEAKVESVKKELNAALLEYGIAEEEISPTVIEAVSDMLIEEFGDSLGSITPLDIENFIKGQKIDSSILEK